MTAYVIDASALLAFILDEHGADIVAEALLDAEIVTTNLGECARRLFTIGWTRAEIEAVIATLDARIVPLDLGLALDAAELEQFTRKRGISSADRVCIAHARRNRAVALTADRAWAGIADAVDVEVALIRYGALTPASA